MADDVSDDAVRRANGSFYAALERADLDLMLELWSKSPDVSCAHPGRKPLVGWADVMASWRLIFQSGGNPQVIVTDEVLVRRGPTAWVTVTENLLSGGAASAASALNVFHHTGDRWEMMAHHATPVLV
ncbi:MAG: nuclear transport factor 2 family protein [Acidimicrobiales bacterium]